MNEESCVRETQITLNEDGSRTSSKICYHIGKSRDACHSTYGPIFCHSTTLENGLVQSVDITCPKVSYQLDAVE